MHAHASRQERWTGQGGAARGKSPHFHSPLLNHPPLSLTRRALPSLSFSALPAMCPHRLAALMGLVADAMAEVAEEEAAAQEAAVALPGREAVFLSTEAPPRAAPQPSVDAAFLALCAASGAGFLALVASLRRVAAACRRGMDEERAPASPLLEPLAPGDVAGAGEAAPVANPAFFGKV